jgi:hypothetical protein
MDMSTAWAISGGPDSFKIINILPLQLPLRCFNLKKGLTKFLPGF